MKKLDTPPVIPTPGPDTKTSPQQADGGLESVMELPRLMERMHRRYLDLVRLELARLGADDISPVQFMMLQNIGQGSNQGSGQPSNNGKNEISVRDLIERGYYLGSNASYNLKQLVDQGYVDRSAAARDKRTARLKLSAKGAKLYAAMRSRDQATLEPLLADKTLGAAAETARRLLRQLERRWSEVIRDDSPMDGDIDL